MAIQFPNNPGIGSVFTDTTVGFSYEWDGTVWKSFTPAAANNIKELDDISSGFDGSTTTFNLTIGGIAYQPRSAAMLQISLADVIQEPSTDYTVAGSSITFASAPTGGAKFFGVVRGTAVSIDYAADGNVQTKQEFTATEGQTSFTVTGGYSTGYIDVFRNGVRLGSDDFTDTSETAIVLTVPAQADDLIETVKYNVASLVVSQGEFNNLNVTGIITGGSFSGDGSGLTGVASTDNIITATPVNVLNNVRITGFTTAGAVSASNLNISGISTFSGNVTIGGTLTYQDVEHIDSIGIITAQQGIQVLANGLDINGISTFKNKTRILDDVEFHVGTNGVSGDYKFYRDSGNSYNIVYEDISGGEARFIGNVSGSGNEANFTFLKNTSLLAKYTQNGILLYANNGERFRTNGDGIVITGGATATGVITASSFSGDGSNLTGLSVGITTAERTGLGNTTIFLDLSNAQHHTITLAAGISTIDCTGGSVGDSHSLVLINPSSVGTGVTVGFATDFLFPSGSTPSLPTGANDISLISFVVKQTGAGGTEVLASAGLNYSN